MFIIIANETYPFGMISHLIGIYNLMPAPEYIVPMLELVAEGLQQPQDTLHWSYDKTSVSINRGQETPWTISAVSEPAILAQYIKPKDTCVYWLQCRDGVHPENSRDTVYLSEEMAMQEFRRMLDILYDIDDDDRTKEECISDQAYITADTYLCVLKKQLV